MTAKIIPVIICGGAGTRLWPVSRESMPKQFVPLVGAQSTFQQILTQVSDRNVFERPIVITLSDFRFVVAEQLRECGIEAEIVLEPMRRDSGVSVATAAALALKRNRDNLVLVLASDQIINKPDAFSLACKEAAATAAKGYIVTFGIKPSGPVTSYGYIRPGQVLSGTCVRMIEEYVEKPNADIAERYVADGYLWNSGNFLFNAATVLSEIEHFEPVMAEAAKAAVANLTYDLDFIRLPSGQFARAPLKSFDYAVLERTMLAAVLPVDIGWSDVNNWDSVWGMHDHDSSGNATQGPVVIQESRNSLVRSEGQILTTLIGLDDVIVVSTVDAVLVAARDKAEQVRLLVDEIKLRNYPAAVEHRRVHRPWGYYQDIDSATRFRVKRIVVTPGSMLSLQMHYHRSEHWVVVRGTAEVTVNQEVLHVHENESVYIPIGATHRLANPGKITLELIEVQVGSYLGEDDIIRLDDIYKRVPPTSTDASAEAKAPALSP
jgi:mannose-1-phosphate guanylyltransferase/mannose-6-phosphate isomerase